LQFFRVRENGLFLFKIPVRSTLKTQKKRAHPEGCAQLIYFLRLNEIEKFKPSQLSLIANSNDVPKNALMNFNM